MSTNSGIEWTDCTWQVTAGCTRVSPGCKNCYAETMANRLAGMALADMKAGRNPRQKHAYLEVIQDGAWNRTIKLLPEALETPLRWRKARKIFVNSMSDLFHKDVPFEFVDRVFAVMALCPQHTFQVLTKRPERMAKYLSTLPAYWSFRLENAYSGDVMGRLFDVAQQAKMMIENGDEWEFSQWPLPNCWIGTSVEDQTRAYERIPWLLKCPAAKRFLSCEPLLGPLNIRGWLMGEDGLGACAVCGNTMGCECPGDGPMIDWVIVGGESGGGARAFDYDWARSIRDQCQAAGVAFFMKQGYRGCKLKKCPADLRVREMPK